jgi:hypothetical protein
MSTGSPISEGFLHLIDDKGLQRTFVAFRKWRRKASDIRQDVPSTLGDKLTIPRSIFNPVAPGR